jgi:hypothetical protein
MTERDLIVRVSDNRRLTQHRIKDVKLVSDLCALRIWAQSEKIFPRIREAAQARLQELGETI